MLRGLVATQLLLKKTFYIEANELDFFRNKLCQTVVIRQCHIQVTALRTNYIYLSIHVCYYFSYYFQSKIYHLLTVIVHTWQSKGQYCMLTEHWAFRLTGQSHNTIPKQNTRTAILSRLLSSFITFITSALLNKEEQITLYHIHCVTKNVP